MKLIVRARRGLRQAWRHLRPIGLEVPLTVILIGSEAHAASARVTYKAITHQTVWPRRIFVPPGIVVGRQRRNTPDVVVEPLVAGDLPPLAAVGAVLRAGADLSGGVVVALAGMRYPANWLASLYSESLVYPKAIIAGDCLAITLDSDGRLRTPQTWPTCSGADCRVDVVPISTSGVLYPWVWLDAFAVSAGSISLAEDEGAWHDLWARTLSLAEGIPVRCLGLTSRASDATQLPPGYPSARVAQALEKSLE